MEVVHDLPDDYAPMRGWCQDRSDAEGAHAVDLFQSRLEKSVFEELTDFALQLVQVKQGATYLDGRRIQRVCGAAEDLRSGELHTHRLSRGGCDRTRRCCMHPTASAVPVGALS